jgi:hypothetical protein
MTKDPCPYMPSLFLSESQAPFGSLTHQLCNSKSPTSERQKNPARGPGCRAQSGVYFCCWPPSLSLFCLGSPWVCCCGVGAGDAGFCVSLDDGAFVIVCSFQRNLSTIQLLAEAGYWSRRLQGATAISGRYIFSCCLKIDPPKQNNMASWPSMCF